MYLLEFRVTVMIRTVVTIPFVPISSLSTMMAVIFSFNGTRYSHFIAIYAISTAPTTKANDPVAVR